MRERYALPGKVALITGAGRSIGAALARKLHLSGAHVALTDVDEDAAAGVAEELGYPARAFHADVTDLASVERAVEEAVGHFGRLDVVVANAGLGRAGSVARGEPRDFERVIEVNLLGVYRTLRAAAPHVTRTKGYFMAMASMAAAIQSPLQGAYGASKAAVSAMANSFRLEVRPSGAKVGVVYPTFVKDSGMVNRENPLGEAVWEGHQEGGPWATVPLEEVVEEVVRGIERRARWVPIPRGRLPVMMCPGIFQPLVERMVFKPEKLDAVMRAEEQILSNPAASRKR